VQEEQFLKNAAGCLQSVAYETTVAQVDEAVLMQVLLDAHQ
jgi:hypothetical protein